MKYTRSIGDIYETFEGTPDEIAELMMRMPEKIELETGETIDEEEMKHLEKKKGVPTSNNSKSNGILLDKEEYRHLLEAKEKLAMTKEEIKYHLNKAFNLKDETLIAP